jgi:hypothetical protein
MTEVTNHVGWCVEIYSNAVGWIQFSDTFESAAEANAELDYLRRCTGNENLRVYEVLDL